MKELLMRFVEFGIREGSELYTSYKPLIFAGVGFVASSVPEYFLGNSKHKSLLGFLKHVFKRKKKEDAEKPKE